MEEKNVTKISLSTFFLILAIIAIIVMGVFIYKLNNDKTAEIQKSTELQAQVNSLSTTINDLQNKINSISNIKNNNPEPNTNSNTGSNYYLNTNTTTERDNRETKNDEIVGKWNAYKAVNSNDGSETTNMRVILGSSYAEL